MPNLSKLKRKDSSQIGVKDVDSQTNKQKRISRRGQNSKKDSHLNKNDSKMNVMLQKNNLEISEESVREQYLPVLGPPNASSSSNTSGLGYNEKCRLTISFQNKTANFSKPVKNAAFNLFEMDSSIGTFRHDHDEVRYESTKNLSSKIWSWFSSQNYLSVDNEPDINFPKSNSFCSINRAKQEMEFSND